ncbi:uncharacterized protein LOC134400197 [Elgaria multicarinata webbii]|uniref:uncharacterized protein LOC134400197 n=1 Tax=Elgaria multicarinata webbii TaxID=159646 RepID=UPI002FCCE7A0
MENPIKGRGPTWRHYEILDLLNIWGEQRIQEQLRTKHRNLNSFEYIAMEMGKKGHSRTAQECRSKTKSLRFEYRKVYNHNNRSGKKFATCPYYDELHSILREDATIRPKRVSSSIKLIRTEAELDSYEESLEDNSEPVTTINDTEEETRNGYHQDNSMIIQQSGTTETNEESTSTKESTVEINVPPIDTGIPNHKATLSPATRLALIRNRKRRLAGNEIAEKIMRHCSKENEKIISIMNSESEAFASYAERSARNEEKLREDRQELLKSVKETASLLKVMVNSMHASTSNFSITNSAVNNSIVFEDCPEPVIENIEISTSPESNESFIEKSGTPKKVQYEHRRPTRNIKRPLVFSP